MKIFAVGMNYALHNKELDGALYKPEAPVIFTKADSALLKDGKPFFIVCLHTFIYRYYDAVTVGIDFTARDWQEKARAKGLPWEICKGFDGSAVIGQWVEKEKFRDVQALQFHLDINGTTVQQGCTSDMLYKIDELIAYISTYFTLKTGDLLYTGTPVGVGPVKIDDHLEGWVEDRKVLDFNCK